MAFKFKRFFSLPLILFLCISLNVTKLHSISKGSSRWYNGVQFLKNLFKRPTLHQKSTKIIPLHKIQHYELAGTKKTVSYSIRVLLNEKKNNDAWVLGCAKGFVLTNVQSNCKKRYAESSLKISFKNGNLMVNGMRISEKQIKIDAGTDHLTYENHDYQGSLLLVVEQGHCYVINQINLEDYIYSVLRSESWPGWPLEVNKAFAIASRSYAMVKYLEGVKGKKPYHIKNTNAHQTYNGFHTNKLLKQAVEETTGLILTHNKKPIIAMFDCCCGDVIPAHLNTIDFKKAPYLARKVPCTFCKSSKIYQWKLEFDVDEFQKLLHVSGYMVKQIRDIYVAKKDKAGAVEEIIIKDHDKKHILTGKQFYAMVSKVKSFCYSVSKKGKKIHIAGKGYGHHLGICQWGARNMINHGWNYQSILGFYYPGTTFMKLTPHA